MVKVQLLRISSESTKFNLKRDWHKKCFFQKCSYLNWFAHFSISNG